MLVISAASSPHKDSKTLQLQQKQRDAFEAFAEKTSDAWDDADDDLIMMANVKMSLKDVHSTAMQVSVGVSMCHGKACDLVLYTQRLIFPLVAMLMFCMIIRKREQF